MEPESKLETGPPALIESIVQLLTPPASREHVLGDFHERYRVRVNTSLMSYGVCRSSWPAGFDERLSCRCSPARGCAFSSTSSIAH
jgi:hypothetical protein